MKERELLTRPRTVAVFDIETRLDEAAAHTAGHKGTGLRPALQKLATASLLLATEQQDGSWAGFELRTFSAPATEFDVLMSLDEELSRIDQPGSVLVTYNGREHDLAVLRRRAARYWMFGLSGLSRMAEIDHLDLMLWQRRGRRDAVPSLRDTCAGLGIGLFEEREAEGRRLSSNVRKAESDVVATFILYLYEAAIMRGSPIVLRRGWEALSAFILGMRATPEHLKHFGSHPLLKAARAAENRTLPQSLTGS
jgi:hypothetical protein